MENKKLTIEEALEQGYTMCIYGGYSNALDLIEDAKDIDFTREPYFLEPTMSHPGGLSSKEIAEMMAEQLQLNYSELVDDDETVYNIIKELDFKDMEDKITEALSKVNYYPSTNIKLIP